MKRFYTVTAALASCVMTVCAQGGAPWQWSFPAISVVEDQIANYDRTGKGNLNIHQINNLDLSNLYFDEVWTKLASENEITIGMQSNEFSPKNADDYSGKAKVFYDDKAVYAVLNITDDEVIPGKDGIEIMFDALNRPLTTDEVEANFAFDKIDRDKLWNTPTVTVSWADQVKYHQLGYWDKFGAAKITINWTEDPDTKAITPSANYLILKADGQGDGNGNPATVLKFDALKDVYIEKFTGTAKGYGMIVTLPFDNCLNKLTPVMDGKIQFEVKNIDADSDDADGKYTNSLWQTAENNVYAYTYYLGNLTFKGLSDGVKEKRNDKVITMFPNPSAGDVNLSENSDVDVLNLTGQVVFSAKRTNKISGLNAGTYIVKLGDGSVNKLIIK